MRILVISNLFPPHFIGGYELGCAQVCEGLQARGHTLQVLCSSFGVDKPRAPIGKTPDLDVRRELQHDFNGFLSRQWRRFKRISRDEHNEKTLRQRVESFAPDVIFVWNLGGVTRELALIAPSLKPTAFFISDDWLARWPLDDVAKRDFSSRGAMFCSRYLQEFTAKNGWNLEGSHVVHWGVDAAQFSPSARESVGQKMLFCGQIVPHKGAHTALEAFFELSARFPDLELTFAGGSRHSKYLQQLQRRAKKHPHGNRVHWRGQMARETLPQLLREHDIFLLPSVWDEPFSITLLEAMASGLACVSTLTGGSGEIVRDGENALAFEADNSSDCARQIERLLQKPELCAQLGRAARQTVEENFRIESMTQRIEAVLTDFLAHSSR